MLWSFDDSIFFFFLMKCEYTLNGFRKIIYVMVLRRVNYLLLFNELVVYKTVAINTSDDLCQLWVECPCYVTNVNIPEMRLAQ